MTPNEVKHYFDLIKKELNKKVFWQEKMIKEMIISLFVWWHILLEWAPWLAKTLAVETFSKVSSLSFKRIQFTPDLLPQDLLWTEIYKQNTGEFEIKKWPIFSDFILADEINRSPSKVQSALLEAMAEKQITISDETFPLGDNFMVFATQNPLEQEWTYPLPEAQLDRFLFKSLIDYPSFEEEKNILITYWKNEKIDVDEVLDLDKIADIKKSILNIYVDDSILNYILKIVEKTRQMPDYIEFWASPRASLALIKTAKANAIISWRDFVIPEDIMEMVFPVLRHRIILNYSAISEGFSADDIISKILEETPIS